MEASDVAAELHDWLRFAQRNEDAPGELQMSRVVAAHEETSWVLVIEDERFLVTVAKVSE